MNASSPRRAPPRDSASRRVRPARSECSRRSSRGRRTAPDRRARRDGGGPRGDRSRTSWPSTVTVPSSGSSSRSSRSAIVDLPLPLGPTIATRSPGATANDADRAPVAAIEGRTCTSSKATSPRDRGERASATRARRRRAACRESRGRGAATRARSRGSRTGPSAPAPAAADASGRR